MNDGVDCLKRTTDYCSERGFKFKFLNFEAITPSQATLTQPVQVVDDRVREAGVEPLPERGKSFRGQSDYLPIQWQKYSGVDSVVIEVGCGVPEVCKLAITQMKYSSLQN